MVILPPVGGLSITIGKIDRFIDDQTYLEAIGAFKLTLDILQALVTGWINDKAKVGNLNGSTMSPAGSSTNYRRKRKN